MTSTWEIDCVLRERGNELKPYLPEELPTLDFCIRDFPLQEGDLEGGGQVDQLLDQGAADSAASHLRVQGHPELGNVAGPAPAVEVQGQKRQPAALGRSPRFGPHS